jgi:hypothetical protein
LALIGRSFQDVVYLHSKKQSLQRIGFFEIAVIKKKLPRIIISKTIKPSYATTTICVRFCLVGPVSGRLQKDGASEPGTGSFIDLGFIPAVVSAGADIASFQSAIYNKGHVFVATSDGIWKSNLSQKQWSRSGLEGRIITAIYKHPTIEDRFFAGTRSTGKAASKTLYLSTDGGTSWQPAAEPVFNSLDQVYEEYACFAVRPNHPNVVYANLDGGTMIAVSTDGGMHWVRKNNEPESYFGYNAAIAFLPGNPDRLFQGAESPLDIAWLAAMTLTILTR